ncbi:unnamed protein product [Strongylus vulgaris]|uniref:Uncharacterized protein n=1 Tax=Strongylus vulgaris TaxID=40348 RepID=A0A3P7KXR4_STRVU|nr:unnamed protein product [Strongylus vulgaris]
MESLRRFGTTMHEFWRGVVEWRSPASGPYLMIVNIAFWSAALYCSELVQLRLLWSIAAGVVGWDILLAPTHEHSIATHIALWPVQSIWRLASIKTATARKRLYNSVRYRYKFFAASFLSTKPVATGTVFLAVGCLLVNPVWNYYEVNQKIANGALYCGKKAADVATVSLGAIWHAIKSAAVKTGNAIKNGVYSIMTGIKNGAIYVVTSIRNGVVYVVTAIKNGVVGVVMAIKNGINGVLYIVTGIKDGFCWIGRGIKNGVLATIYGIKNGIQATARYIADLCCRIANWIHMRIIEPTKNGIYAIGRWLRYWFCAYWWPDLKQWMKIRIGEPLRRAFNYFCYGLMYVFCGYWIPPVKAFLGKWFGRFKDFLVAQIRRLGGYLHETVVVPTKNYFRRKFDEFRSWLRQFLHRIALSIRYFRRKFDEFRSWLRQFLHRIALSIRCVDDSDVELEGMLPDEITEEIEKAADGSESEDSLLDLAPTVPPDGLRNHGFIPDQCAVCNSYF